MTRIGTFQTRNPEELRRQLSALERQVNALAASVSRGSVTTTVSEISDDHLGFAYVYEDFLARPLTATATTSDTVGGVTFQSVSSGTYSHVTSSVPSEHPGIMRLGLPATIGAAAGVICAKHVSRGGEWLWVTFRTASTFANLTAKIGLIATSMAAEPTDGVYLWQTPGTSTFGFKSANASTRTTGATTTLAVDTWYTLGVRMSDARDSCSVLLLNDSGVTVLSYSLVTNLPSGSVDLEMHASVRTTAAVAVAQALDLDLIRVRLGSSGKPLTRPVPPGEWSL